MFLPGGADGALVEAALAGAALVEAALAGAGAGDTHSANKIKQISLTSSATELCRMERRKRKIAYANFHQL